MVSGTSSMDVKPTGYEVHLSFMVQKNSVGTSYLMEKIHYLRWNMSVVHVRMCTSAQQGQEPTNLELQEEDHLLATINIY